MRTRLGEEEGAADAWGQTISDTCGGEGNGAGATAAGPAYGMGREESEPHGDGGKAELGYGRSGSWAAWAKSQEGKRTYNFFLFFLTHFQIQFKLKFKFFYNFDQTQASQK